MKRMTLEPQRVASEIYIIFRVFSLDRKNMGVRIYLDPEGLRREGSLDFISESYSVIPSNGN
jgi:hypothetical protein